jgi:hypothetical protein
MKTPATSIPLAVALRSMLAENEAKIAAAPGEQARLRSGPPCWAMGLRQK